MKNGMSLHQVCRRVLAKHLCTMTSRGITLEIPSIFSFTAAPIKIRLWLMYKECAFCICVYGSINVLSNVYERFKYSIRMTLGPKTYRQFQKSHPMVHGNSKSEKFFFGSRSIAVASRWATSIWNLGNIQDPTSPTFGTVCMSTKL